MSRGSWLLLVAGPLVGALTLVGVHAGGAPGAPAVDPWRVIALPSALGAVAAGLTELLTLARSEWRRERPPARRYVASVVLFVLALVLAVVATR
jgi:hypothetical protein